MDGLLVAARILASFVVGAIPFAKVAMIGTGIDITKAGSKNPGFNNVLRVCREAGIGSKNLRGGLALIGDIGKGFLALSLFSRGLTSPALWWLTGIAAVVGHCWSPFLGWNGGKGVATTVGVLVFLEWPITLACLPLYPLLRFFGRRMGWKQEGAISSMTTMFVMSTLVFFLRGAESGVFAYIMFIIIVIRHAPNIREIFG
jgi:acyl phosphate:glycerol-3-phosphate acyltransferase